MARRLLRRLLPATLVCYANHSRSLRTANQRYGAGTDNADRLFVLVSAAGKEGGTANICLLASRLAEVEDAEQGVER